MVGDLREKVFGYWPYDVSNAGTTSRARRPPTTFQVEMFSKTPVDYHMARVVVLS